MNKIAVGCAVVAALVCGGAGAAGSSDENLGCTIALCMANPNGPTAVQECVAPIRKRAELIARGKRVPKCAGMDDDNGGGDRGGGGNGPRNPNEPRQQQQ